MPLVRGSFSSCTPRSLCHARASRVPGQNYQICNEQSRYLTSPWTYHALASGSRSYTVSQYKALPGYGRTLPPLPSYIASESPATEAAVIYAPGSSVSQPAYDFPETPLLYFFEGGAYGEIAFQTVPGDQFIGGSTSGYREPTFNDGGAAAGISAQNATYDFSGGASTLASSAPAGARTITTRSPIGGYISWLADLCRWHDLPHLECLGHHDHAGIRADDRGERRPDGVRQQATPDRLRIDRRPTGRDIGEARRGHHSACPLRQRGDRGRLLHDRGSCWPARAATPSP